MSNLQTLTVLSRTERDNTGRKVNIYRKTTKILSKEAEIQRRIDRQRKKQEDESLKKWEGVALLPRYAP